MAWSSLKDRLGTAEIPLLLAGPILRRVTPTSVTVWVALKNPATVGLFVYRENDTTPVMQSASPLPSTIALGTNLHVLAVTAQSNDALSEQSVYTYDLVFNTSVSGSLSQNLTTAAGATDTNPFAYSPWKLPSFVLPPTDLNALRIIHGSCRKPNGDGTDNLYLVDNLINQAVTSASPLLRPHQLLLMGDQIYADDVADALLLMLTDASDALLGWTETLPAPVKGGGPFKATDRPVYTRWQMLDDAGFTSEDLRSHLLSLGEYLSMYLFAWSDVPWPDPATPLPSFDQIKSTVMAVRANFPPSEWLTFWTRLNNNENGIKNDGKSLDGFRKTLPKVRKALANIPCYMICDDHEVTDDWNMTRDFCEGVYGHDIGVRVVQNALVAYALCQHWGNTPEQFTSNSAQEFAGFTLLTLLDKGNAASYDTNSKSICSMVGVHTYDDIKKRTPPAVFHDPASLDYHFTVEGPGHQIIFTDTRTWRAFLHGGGEGGDLLPVDQFKAQIADTPSLRTAPPLDVDRALLVVLTTNAPETEALRAFTRHDWLANKKKRFPDIWESWELPSVPLDRLLKTLTDKLPPNGSIPHYGPVILLSGDVHHSFATRMVYEATKRFEDDPHAPQAATAVFVQLVASSLKKQSGDTVDIHKDGYHYDPVHVWTPDHVQEAYVGWNIPKGAPAQIVGTGDFSDLIPGSSLQFPVSVDYDHPTLSVTTAIPDTPIGFVLETSPDYRYRLEYLSQSTAASSTTLEPISLPPTTGESPGARQQAIANFKAGMDQLRQYNGDGGGGGDIVGLNNVCELTFEWGSADDKYVTHKVRWRYPPDTDMVLVASYRIKLDPADFPDITPPVRP